MSVTQNESGPDMGAAGKVVHSQVQQVAIFVSMRNWIFVTHHLVFVEMPQKGQQSHLECQWGPSPGLLVKGMQVSHVSASAQLQSSGYHHRQHLGQYLPHQCNASTEWIQIWDCHIQ